MLKYLPPLEAHYRSCSILDFCLLFSPKDAALFITRDRKLCNKQDESVKRGEMLTLFERQFRDFEESLSLKCYIA